MPGAEPDGVNTAKEHLFSMFLKRVFNAQGELSIRHEQNILVVLLPFLKKIEIIHKIKQKKDILYNGTKYVFRH